MFGSSWAKRPNEKRLFQLVRTQGHYFQVEMIQACLHPQIPKCFLTLTAGQLVFAHINTKRRKACPYIKETNPIVNPMENVAYQAHISIFTRTIPVKQKKSSWDFNSSRVFLLLKLIVLPFELDKYLGTTPDTPDTQVPELRRFRGCFCLTFSTQKTAESRIRNFSHNFQAPGTIRFYSTEFYSIFTNWKEDSLKLTGPVSSWKWPSPFMPCGRSWQSLNCHTCGFSGVSRDLSFRSPGYPKSEIASEVVKQIL